MVISRGGSMSVLEKVEVYLSQLDTRLKEMERTDHIIKTAFGITAQVKLEAKKLIFKDAEDAIAFCRDMDSRLQEVENYRSPTTIQNKITQQIGLIEEMSNQLSGVMQRFRALEFDDRFLVLYTDEDFKEWYTKSGLIAQDVKKYLDSIEKKDISLATVSLILSGKIQDLKTRSLLGNLFKREALKKTKANN
jgi:hypothetical protein